jgi:hypothetical protein
VLAQLRDMLAAKNSSIVTKKNNDSGAALPQRPQADVPTVGVGKHNVSEAVAESFLHVGSLLHGGGGKALDVQAKRRSKRISIFQSFIGSPHFLLKES